MNEFMEYLRLVFVYMAEHRGHVRTGQAYYNVLAERRPDILSDVAGDRTLDPYYRDENIPAFLTWLCSVMSDPKCNPES